MLLKWLSGMHSLRAHADHALHAAYTVYYNPPNKALRLLTASAGGAAPRPPPVPAASSDRVAECALRCLLALLRGTYAAPPWDPPPPEPGAAAGQGEHGHPAKSAHRDKVTEALVPAPGVLVDLLQRLAALAELGRERSAEEVLLIAFAACVQVHMWQTGRC